MRRKITFAVCTAAALAAGPALPAFAQMSTGGTSVGAGSTTGTTGSNLSPGTDTMGTSSDAGSSNVSPIVTDPTEPSTAETGLGSPGMTSQSGASDLGTTDGTSDLGTSADTTTTTQGRASAGSSTIDSANADNLARSGTSAGTTPVTTFGGNGGYQATAGAGSSRMYRIPEPSVGVDLGGIRRGLEDGPSAIPKANGD